MGEQYDPNLGFYYLRARFYNPSSGRFTQMDTWQGNMSDPVTLHKYLYANANPVNMIDPTGNFSLGSVTSGIGSALNLSLRAYNAYSNVTLLFDIARGNVTGPELVLAFFASKRLPKSRFKCRNSFLPETLVSTDDGLVNIENINIGDYVWSFDEVSSDRSLQEVVHLISSNKLQFLVDIELNSGEIITSTREHPFYLENEQKWVLAGDLQIGQTLYNSNQEVVKVRNVRSYVEEAQVYNLTVDNTHTYYVGETRVLTHNMGPCERPTVEWDHILRGNFKKRGFGGWHHNPGGITPSSRGFLSRTDGPDGFYTAKVYGRNTNGKLVRKKSNNGESTFFPDNWSTEKVKAVIMIAYRANGRKSGDMPLSKLLPNGSSKVDIRVIVDKTSNKIITAFPVIR